MTTLIHRNVAACRAGTYPNAICRIHSGWVVLGAVQFLKGYSLLLPDPVVPDLNALGEAERAVLLNEMAILGDVLLEVTGAVRINYEILGNLEPALHLHLFPRYLDEPEALKTKPVWFYDWDHAPAFDAVRDAPVMAHIRQALQVKGLVART